MISPSRMGVSAPRINDRPSLDLSDGCVVINMQTSVAMILTRTFVVLQAWKQSVPSPPHLRHGVAKIWFNPNLQGSASIFMARTMARREKVLSAEVWYLDIKVWIYSTKRTLWLFEHMQTYSESTSMNCILLIDTLWKKKRIRVNMS